MAKTILICDDDPTQRRLISAVLEREGFHTRSFDHGQALITALGEDAHGDVIILDLVMPGLSGQETMKELKSRGIRIPVIVLTASAGIDTVVKAMQAGAQDFFVKPASPERILVGVRNALSLGDMVAEVSRLTKKVQNRTGFDDLIGNSLAMSRVKRIGERAAKSNIPVLILGESGVGKELIARAIQGSSERAGKPFVSVNCGALPTNLVESILFGHEKGSFTGAGEKHAGKFQEAHGGTLFLDEVGELPLEMQVKLLRALQEGEIDPIGAKRPVKVDVRIISATNRNLEDQVKSGHFREDLFYRLNVFPIDAPSLRERKDDIPILVDHFIRRYNVEEGLKIQSISREALELVCQFDWPGNVRQLENALYRAMILADQPILQVYDFPSLSGLSGKLIDANILISNNIQKVLDDHQNVLSSLDEPPVRILDAQGHLRKLEEIERDLIEHAISIYAGHMSEVARRLGIGRSTLYRKVKDCGLEGLIKDAS